MSRHKQAQFYVTIIMAASLLLILCAQIYWGHKFHESSFDLFDDFIFTNALVN